MRKAFRRGAVAALATALLVVGIPSPTSAQPPEVVCGQVITRSTTLTDDVGPCPGDGIVIGADNITLNLNGHRVFGTEGPGDGTAAGIRLPNRTNVRILGGAVTDFDAGVFINLGSKNKVLNMTVRDNIGPASADAFLGDGIVMFKSANNEIRNNLVVHNGIYDGIGGYGIGADGNIVEGNTVKETVGIPHRRQTVQGGTGIIFHNFLYPDEVRRGDSIRDNHVTGNVVRKNDSSGISMVSSIHSTVVRNRVEENGQFYVKNSVPVDASDDPGNGIGVTFSQQATFLTHVLVKDNDSFRNLKNGIWVRALENEILDNDTGFNAVVDLVDRVPPDCGLEGYGFNTWFGNSWGPTSPLAVQYGLPAYVPDCTSNGGSGPEDAPPGASKRPLFDEEEEVEDPQPLRGNPTKP